MPLLCLKMQGTRRIHAWSSCGESPEWFGGFDISGMLENFHWYQCRFYPREIPQSISNKALFLAPAGGGGGCKEFAKAHQCNGSSLLRRLSKIQVISPCERYSTRVRRRLARVPP